MPTIALARSLTSSAAEALRFGALALVRGIDRAPLRCSLILNTHPSELLYPAKHRAISSRL